jgi:signal transduction histidine kinase
MQAMNSLSDVRISSRRLPGRAAALWLGLGLAAALVGLLALLVRQADGIGLIEVLLIALGTAVVLLVVAGLGWHIGVRLTRQQLGEALRESRLQAQMLAQLQPHWQWACDAEHRLLRWQSPQTLLTSQWMGAAAPQTLWQRFELLDGGAEGLQQLLLGGAASFDVEAVASDGGGARWRLRGLACLDGQGRFNGYHGTAEALATEPLPTLTPAPLAAVSAEPPAQQIAHEHESFSYTVSHDLRAPLRVVEGFTRILKEDYGRLLDRIGNDHLDRVMGAAARMNSMIDSLLSLAQLSAQPLARQPVNLSQLAGFVVEELARGAPERSVHVHIQPHMLVQGDPTLLRMVLENLLGNAWKYSGKCAQPLIRFEAQQEAGLWIYRVSDNGAGFDMRFADRLFGVFQRLHSASEFQGTGVGLASVRRIVRRHGGEIWAEAVVGEGAQFYFTLAG